MQKKIFKMFLVVVFALSYAGLAFAGSWANPELLLEAKQLKKDMKKSDWVVVDCRDLKNYAKGHIPGAISLGKRCKKALRDTTSRAFTDFSKYEKLFSKVGISDKNHVVVYGEHKITDTLKDTAVAFWIFEYLGVKNVHFLNGGIDNWINAGFPLENKPNIRPKTTFNVNVVASRIATTEEVGRIATGKSKAQLIDARSAKEYRGADIRALRGGHIPNVSINVSHKDTFDKDKDPGTGKMVDNGFFSPDKVAGFYKSLDKNKRTIGYCQTGTRSTITYLQLRLLGFTDPANYDESWRVYGSHNNDYPIEDEQWFDFNKINKLEKKIKKLEKKLKK